MRISFSPQFSDAKLELSANGEALTINGDTLDFSDMPDGGSYPSEAIENDMVVGGVTRVDGEIKITVILPYNLSNPPRSVAFPDAITVTSNGRIALPTDGA